MTSVDETNAQNNAPMDITLTLILLIGGIALFALCFRCIDWFEQI